MQKAHQFDAGDLFNDPDKDYCTGNNNDEYEYPVADVDEMPKVHLLCKK